MILSTTKCKRNFDAFLMFSERYHFRISGFTFIVERLTSDYNSVKKGKSWK
jgi:hypothetical protein